MEESHSLRCSEAKLAKVSPFGATRINLRFSSEPKIFRRNRKRGLKTPENFPALRCGLRITIAAAFLGN